MEEMVFDSGPSSLRMENGMEESRTECQSLWSERFERSILDQIARAVSDEELEKLNASIENVDTALEEYALNRADYAWAIFSGILCGGLDALFTGEFKISEEDTIKAHEQTNTFVQKSAAKSGYEGDGLKGAIAFLEKKFPVAQDNVWKGQGINISTKNHHMADIAHHPTPAGFFCSVAVQALDTGLFVNKNGEWHILGTEKDSVQKIQILTGLVLSASLNWLVWVGESLSETESDESISPALSRAASFAASTPAFLELAHCATKWFGHLVSDMAGSNSTPGAGMGIPGIFLSLLYEFASLPFMKETGLLEKVNELYEKEHWDFRKELPIYQKLIRQSIPVLLNELLVRVGFFVMHLASELQEHQLRLDEINWENVIPFHKRTVTRMADIASLTFTLADTMDALGRAAIESAGNWVLFAGTFAARVNLVGTGRAAISFCREVTAEEKTAQLLHERALLTEERSSLVMDRLQQYKADLEARVAAWLQEDLEDFSAGLALMDEGLEGGDSELVIAGNMMIQERLHGEMQFTSQDEFDDLMESDAPFVF